MSTLLEQTLARVRPVDGAAARAAQAALDAKTKPRRSLGRLEDLACQVAGIRREERPSLGDKAIVVMAADHGVAEEGVSAYPSAVTVQMLLNFARGGAAINVLARQAGAQVVVADLGVLEPPPPTLGLRSRRIGPGTANLARGPAMTEAQARDALTAGIELADELADAGIGLVGLGEMGIGNTTAASALCAAFTGLPPEEVTGLGTGIDEAGLAGVALGAASRSVGVVVDGFIASAAALVAARLCPALRGYLLPSHRSVEPGHAALLRELGLRPLLDLECRLGEGTGAALAMTLIESAVAILRDMATFESAGVSDSGR